jgi:hypothetical protein
MRSLALVLGITCLTVLSAGAAWALEYNPAATVAAIQADVNAGLISVDQAALYLAYAITGSGTLPAQYLRAAESVSTWYCGTPAMIKLRALLAQTSPQVGAEVEQLLLPGRLAGEQRRAAPEALADNPNGVDLPNVYYSGHFAIRWGNNYSGGMDAIEYWGEILESEVWATEITAWGFSDVYLTDEYYIDMYVGNSGNGAPSISFTGAYTTIYNGNYQPYIVFHPDILYYPESTQEVSAHEFFHTIQFSLGVTYENTYIFDSQSLWFVEGSSTWAEGTVYPNYDGYVYYIYDWAENPGDALTSDNGGYAPYARVIWGRYLYEYYDGIATMYDIWTHNRGSSALFGNAGYLVSQGVQWQDAFLDFVDKVLRLDFEDGDEMPSFDPYRIVSTYPYAEATVSPAQQPHINSLHMILLRAGDEADPRVNIRFEGEAITLDDVAWAVVAYKKDGDGNLTIEILQSAETKAKGDYHLDGLGTDYESVYLLLTPISSFEDNDNAKWDYALQVTRGDDPFPGVDDDDDTLPPDDDDDDDDDDNNDDGQNNADNGDDDDSGCGC